MTRQWASFPYEQDGYDYSGGALKKHWTRLHRGDCEPFPSAGHLSALCKANPRLADSIDDFDGNAKYLAERVQAAWRAHHRGDFFEAVQLGIELGVIGAAVANKAAGIYATYLEEDEDQALEIFMEAVERGEAAARRYQTRPIATISTPSISAATVRGISVARALAQGLGGKIKKSLDLAVKLQPKHAEAHTALGLYHAEIIDKVGAVVGNLTYGAKKELGLKHFEKAPTLHPESPIAKIEYANGLLLISGDKGLHEARRLYECAKGHCVCPFESGRRRQTKTST